jgi:SAM-dependent methyltransferase
MKRMVSVPKFLYLRKGNMASDNRFFSFLAKRRNPHGDTSVGRWNSRRYYAKQFDVLLKSGALKGEVLEVGPGEGNLAYQCREAGVSYRAIERSAGLYASLKEQGFDVTLGAAPLLPYDSKQFDLVCAMAILEHMPTFNEALELLLECNRVLKATGRLAIVVPDALRGGPDFYNWDYTHSFMTTTFRVEQILGDAGFEIKKLVHFTGLLEGPVRFPIDLLGFAVHTRIAYWLGMSLGMESLMYKFHKTFEPSFMVVAGKIQEETSSSNGK